jgi:hypothetical protein
VSDSARIVRTSFSPNPTQRRFIESQAKADLFSSRRGEGKALSVNTSIPTVCGWKTMGELAVGDQVFDEHGNVCNVRATSDVMLDRPCYRIVFSDGAEFVADAQHLWETTLCGTPGRGTTAVRTTAEIANTLHAQPSAGKWRHRVAVAGALQLPEVALPIDPYTLGVWLGDGNSSSGLIYINDEDVDILENIQAVRKKANQAGCGKYRIDGFTTLLREHDLIGNKHIPPSYFRASYAQRLALLQGLLDTDGTVTAKSQVELSLCCLPLAAGALNLIRSLGFRVGMSIADAVLNGRVVGTRYRIRFRAYDDTPVFRTKRKLLKLKQAPKARLSTGRHIVECAPVESVPVKCIAVDSPSRMFLAGEHLVPTHNSTALCWSIFYHTRHNPGANWAVVRDTFENLQRTTMKTFFEWFPPGVYGTYHETKKVWTWAEGVGRGTVTFVGMDNASDATRFLSWELGGIALDEPAPATDSGGIDEMVFDLGMTCLRQPNMQWYCMKLAENNPDESHWSYRKFAGPEADDRFRLWQPPEPENIANLPAEYYENMRRSLAHRPDLVRRFVDGEFGFQSQGRSVTPQWSDKLHLATGLYPVPGKPLHLLWDFGHCVDADTQVLTEDGWRAFPLLTGAEKLGTWNPSTQVVEFQKPTALISKMADRVWEYENHTVSMGLTEEHRIVGYGGGRDGKGWKIRTVAETVNKTNPHMHVPVAGAWPETTEFEPPISPALLGFYIAEGSTWGDRVTLYQKTRDPSVDEMLEQTPWEWQWYDGAKGGFWWTNSRELAQILKPLGVAKTKRLPSWWRKMGAADMRQLFRFYIKGDGNFRRPERGGELTSYTASEALADDLQELGFYLGYSPRVTWRAPTRSWYDPDKRWITSNGGYVLAFRTSKTAYLSPKKHGRWIEESQPVYCATVPNGTLVCRRHGRVFITGNSPTCLVSQIVGDGTWNFLDTMVGDGIGVEELIEGEVGPLLMQRYGQRKYELRHIGDPQGKQREQTSIHRSPRKLLLNMLGGTWKDGPVRLPQRIEPSRSVLTKTVGGRGLVQVDRHRAKHLWWALRGGWHYPVSRSGIVGTAPIKNEWSHPGDAFSYGAGVLFPIGKLAREPDYGPGVRSPVHFQGRMQSGSLGFERPGLQMPEDGAIFGGG